MFPYRGELMKQLLSKIEKSSSASLQIIMKLMVSLLAAANSTEINVSEFRKGFLPYLGKLVFYLTKVSLGSVILAYKSFKSRG